MKKWLFIVIALVLVLALSATLGYALSRGDPAEKLSSVIAEGYLTSSPTFTFDGMADTLRLVEAERLDCPYCWAFEFEFQCRHAGYGDRSGQALAQVITPHTARIVVQEGDVTQATLDNAWDMIEQEVITQ